MVYNEEELKKKIRYIIDTKADHYLYVLNINNPLSKDYHDSWLNWLSPTKGSKPYLVELLKQNNKSTICKLDDEIWVEGEKTNLNEDQLLSIIRSL